VRTKKETDMTVYAALGDSITVGMGDPAPGGGWRGWPPCWPPPWTSRTCATWPRWWALASDVERFQLPAAVAAKPDVASVIVGINDTLRGDFDPERTGAAVNRTVAHCARPGRRC
jgi:lysophospholipase L1-like esterase